MLSLFCLAESSQRSPCEPAAETTVLKQEGKVPSRLALGNRGGYNGRCWGSPVRQKKKHTGGNGLAHRASSAPLGSLVGEELFTGTCSNMTKDTSFKLKAGRFRLDIRKKFFIVRVVRL